LPLPWVAGLGHRVSNMFSRWSHAVSAVFISPYLQSYIDNGLSSYLPCIQPYRSIQQLPKRSSTVNSCSVIDKLPFYHVGVTRNVYGGHWLITATATLTGWLKGNPCWAVLPDHSWKTICESGEAKLSLINQVPTCISIICFWTGNGQCAPPAQQSIYLPKIHLVYHLYMYVHENANICWDRQPLTIHPSFRISYRR
jgi:hypothetical protein